MKIKCRPEDFDVEELTDFRPDGGNFALYRLTKKSIGTPEVVTVILQRWNLARNQLSFGGLKDRHAIAKQHVTIERGPRLSMRQPGFDLEYVGQASRPFGPRDIAGNRFHLVIRDLVPSDTAGMARTIAAIQRDGLPNYFDQQRFGSLGDSGEFIGRAWVDGRYERALWLALAEPNTHDRPDDQKQKEILRRLWGKWTDCKAALDRSNRRSIVTFLADHPDEFKGALGRTDKDMRSLWLAAFQSHLWNNILAAHIAATIPDPVPVEIRSGKLLFFRESNPALRIELPLPSARVKPDGAVKELVDRILAADGLTLHALRIKYPKDSFFSKGSRAAIYTPNKITHEFKADDRYPGKSMMQLSFDLPKGSYATILVKRLTEV